MGVLAIMVLFTTASARMNALLYVMFTFAIALTFIPIGLAFKDFKATTKNNNKNVISLKNHKNDNK